jgi:hypothetical protein
MIMVSQKNIWRSAFFAVFSALLATGAMAHHGWAWTTGKNIKLTGLIEEARLGNPHGVLKVKVNDEMWTVEVGQPWRNQRAGLKDADFAKGTEMTFFGEPSANIEDRRLKVERLELRGKMYELYPRRK